MIPKSIAPSESRFAGSPANPQSHERGEQRQRNDQRDDRGCAQIPQKQVQHDHHQDGALQQILEHRVQCRVDQNVLRS